LEIEGPAGIGKTRLLDELRRRAQEHGLLVLEARAGLLEREFAFGVVRQLLEPVAEPGLMDGPAEAARAVLSDTGTAEGTFPILNGLYRMVEKLAGDRPLALCIDDLQWSDPASLRFTAHLARRVAEAVCRRLAEPLAAEKITPLAVGPALGSERHGGWRDRSLDRVAPGHLKRNVRLPTRLRRESP
jgi:hypothetical protein